MYIITDDHKERLPFVRIKKIELTNYKGVKYGLLELNCSKEYIPFNTKSDILGVYGQNGSGKSSLVEAISVIKGIISGYHIGNEFAKFIDVSTGMAKICIEYDFQYLSGVVATVIYEVKLEAKEKLVNANKSDEIEEKFELALFISDEIIKTDLYADGTIGRMHTIIDTRSKLLCGDSLEEYYGLKGNTELKGEISYLKRKSYDDSQSFVFSDEVSDMLSTTRSDNYSKYYEVLAELELFHNNYLYVIGTSSNGIVQIGAGIPIYMPGYNRPIVLTDKTIVKKETFENVKKTFEAINKVLATIIPDLYLTLETTPTTTKSGDEGYYVKVNSVRGERIFSFNYESDGIIKIVSILADYILAFNQGSTTVVVDEFDSGIFEYLLGELLQIFEQSGKGQFIFTSHNLRPLEVIDKKFIRFTTSDLSNRYYKLKNIGNTNNLRDIYLREVQLGTQDVEIYKKTKAFKITKALREAGEGYLPNGNE